MLTVELLRPEIADCKWLDVDGNSIDKGLVGEPLKLTVTCKNFEEGEKVVFEIFSENTGQDELIISMPVKIKDEKAETEWAYQYKHNPDKPLTEKPKFFFTVTGRRCKEEKGPIVEIGQNHTLFVKDHNEDYLLHTDCTIELSDGSTIQATSDGDGFIELPDKVPSMILSVEFVNQDKKTERLYSGQTME
jgi:hypothetical protein